MKRNRKLGLMVAALGLVAMMSTPASAIFGFGVHAGMDFMSVSDKQFGVEQFRAAAQAQGLTGFNSDGTWNMVTLTREAIDNPYLVGVHFYLDFIPVIDLEVSGDVALQKYKVRYITPNPSVNEDVDAYFGRIGAYVTARKDLIDLPMFAFYLGGGLGMHFVAPVAGDEFIVDIYGVNSPLVSSPNIEDAIERETTLGYHALTGIRFKPPIIPFAIRVEGKYTNTGASGMERPTSTLSAYAGFSLDI